MPNPIIKIKRGTSKPLDFNGTVGLTYAEMGVMLSSTYGNAFYIGNTFGQAITFGCEVSSDITLGGATPSVSKLPTQSAIKGYIASLGVPSGSVGVISRYFDPTSDGQITLAANTSAVVKFFQQDFATSGGITSLTYNTASGLFLNLSEETMNLLITYQITWSGLVSASTYNSLDVIRSAWIQKLPGQTAVLDQNRHGFNTLILPPQQISSAGSITGTQNGSSIITLSPNQGFNIQCKNHSTTNSSSITATALVNNSGTQTTNMLKATNIQIAKI